MRNVLGKIIRLLSRKGFDFFQMLGIHVTGVTYYSPIPDTRVIRNKPELWSRELLLYNLDLNLDRQKAMAEAIWKSFHNEYQGFPLEPTGDPSQYYLNNGSFGFTSGQMHYGILRHFKPKKVIEIGAGYSTLVSLAALRKNIEDGNQSEFVTVEPYPQPYIRNCMSSNDPPMRKELIIGKVEDLPLQFFESLSENDLLFIDSSHTVKIGGDVNFLIFEVLPRLKKGVIIHIHDIHFPHDYFKSYLLKDGFFWQEQYLVQAFLMYNNSFEILWCASYMHHKYPQLMARYFSPYPANRIPTSLYIQKMTD